MKKMMQRLLIKYSMHFNKRYERAGHLFQNRYRSILCEEDSYLLELVRYIHLNPLRAGLVNTYASLGRHPWCGHGALTGARMVAWQETGDVLELFGKSVPEARRAYEEYVGAGASMGQRPDLMVVSPKGLGARQGMAGERRRRMRAEDRILGSGAYVSRVLKEVEHRDRRRAGLSERRKPAEVVERAAKIMGVRAEDVYGGRKTKALSMARSLASKWLVEDLGMTVADVARMLGVTPAAICYGTKRGAVIERDLGASI